MPKSLLDLTTLIERPCITIDGVSYELVSHDELSILDHQRLSSFGRQLEAILKIDLLTAEEESNLTLVLKNTSELILQFVPPEVRAKLSVQNQLRIFEVFTLLPLRNRLQAVAAMHEGSPKSGGSFSLGSNGSTEATPSIG